MMSICELCAMNFYKKNTCKKCFVNIFKYILKDNLITHLETYKGYINRMFT